MQDLQMTTAKKPSLVQTHQDAGLAHFLACLWSRLRKTLDGALFNVFADRCDLVVNASEEIFCRKPSLWSETRLQSRDGGRQHRRHALVCKKAMDRLQTEFASAR